MLVMSLASMTVHRENQSIDRIQQLHNPNNCHYYLKKTKKKKEVEVELVEKVVAAKLALTTALRNAKVGICQIPMVLCANY